jgi:curved DNA-binding protein CbpA
MIDYYGLLGVSREASPSVLKIAYEGKVKALAKGNLSEAERKSEERQLLAAYETLTDPLRRERYEERLEATASREESRAKAIPAIAAVVFLVLAVGGYVGYTRHVAEQKRQLARLEAERVKAEYERQALEAETERAKKEAELFAADRERDAASSSSGSRYASGRYRYSGSGGYNGGYSGGDAIQAQQVEQAVAAMGEQERRMQEERDRWQAQQELARARAEAERQAQWVRDRQAEEERLRAERAAR